MAKPIYIVHHHPGDFAGRSGFPGLIEQVRANVLEYTATWEKLQRRSWTLGHWLRLWGNQHYGSTWNSLVPFRDEWRLARGVRETSGAVVHFIWGEFASPRHPGWFRRNDNRLVSTFHCSIRRLPRVLEGFRCWNAFDAWSVTSRTQIPYFLDHGVDEKDLRVVPLGVDTDYFAPDPAWRPPGEGPLRAILVGKTERDHEFTAEVMKAAPPGLIALGVCTHRDYHAIYRGVPGVEILPFVPDDELLRLYQSAELMFMPFLDCTTNDALMESMACGTPVMTNRVGGIPEYVASACNVLMDDKKVSEWVDRLRELSAQREALWSWRAPVREWALKFSWPVVAEAYRALYDGRPAP